ncbi:MAG: SCO family protein [Thermodesulfobacteriota bacterium]|jgi:protein SCO1/2|nr:MAG: SCO family protein [Candidatus Dadabacteria bacterium]
MKKILIIFIFFLLGISANAVTNQSIIEEEVGWKDRLGDEINKSSLIIDKDGIEQNLEAILDKTKPTVFIFAYYTCPKLCTFLLDGAAEVVLAVNKIRPGLDYNLITLSFDPTDIPEYSQAKEVKYSEDLEKNESWRFFTGSEESIKSIADSVGFKFVKDGDEFAHPSGIIILTKHGRVSRYLSGVLFDKKDFKLALLEASDGVIGNSSISDKVLLYCYGFDPIGRKYALKALNVIKLGGVLTLLLIGVFMFFMWFKKKGGTSK